MSTPTSLGCGNVIFKERTFNDMRHCWARWAEIRVIIQDRRLKAFIGLWPDLLLGLEGAPAVPRVERPGRAARRPLAGRLTLRSRFDVEPLPDGFPVVPGEVGVVEGTA